jgi:hypothetical protein
LRTDLIDRGLGLNRASAKVRRKSVRGTNPTSGLKWSPTGTA